VRCKTSRKPCVHHLIVAGHISDECGGGRRFRLIMEVGVEEALTSTTPVATWALSLGAAYNVALASVVVEAVECSKRKFPITR